MAWPVQPWRRSAQICSWRANRRLRLWAACTWTLREGEAGGTGTILVPSGLVHGVRLLASLTVLSAWP